VDYEENDGDSAEMIATEGVHHQKKPPHLSQMSQLPPTPQPDSPAFGQWSNEYYNGDMGTGVFVPSAFQTPPPRPSSPTPPDAPKRQKVDNETLSVCSQDSEDADTATMDIVAAHAASTTFAPPPKLKRAPKQGTDAYLDMIRAEVQATPKNPFTHGEDKKQSTSWCLTFNRGAGEDMLGEIKTIITDNLTLGVLVYGAMALELAPTTGRKHIHSYIRFSGNQRRKAVQSMFDGLAPWFMAANGTPTQAVDYFKYMNGAGSAQNPTFQEFGIFPNVEAALAVGKHKGGKIAGAKVAARWDEVRAHLKGGKPILDMSDSQILICQYGALQAIQAAYSDLTVPMTIDVLKNYWITGETGIGKSRYAHEHAAMLAGGPGEVYVKNPTNKWWCGYKNQKVVLIDDIGRDGIKATELKIWGDHYRFNAEYKGGSMIIRPRHIIITSNYTLSELYPDPQDLPPLLRRFECYTIKSDKKYGSPQLVKLPAEPVFAAMPGVTKGFTFVGDI